MYLSCNKTAALSMDGGDDDANNILSIYIVSILQIGRLRFRDIASPSFAEP